MTPQIDRQEPVRMYEQPAARFGSDHILRDVVPDLFPEINDMSEYQATPEAMSHVRSSVRRGEIAVAAVVSVEPQTGLYL